MGQIVQGCARTTETMRRTIQHRQEGLNGLARRHGINPKTAAKRRQRTTTRCPMGPGQPRSQELIQAVSYTIHTVLTDNGTRFTPPGNRRSATADIKQVMDCGSPFRAHAFELSCARNNADHRLTQPNHPWTNGRVERMNRTLKEALVKRYHHGTHDQLKEHVQTFLMAYNFAKRLKALRGLTYLQHLDF